MVTSLPINSALPIAKPTIRPKTQINQKRNNLAKANGTSKYTKKI